MWAKVAKNSFWEEWKMDGLENLKREGGKEGKGGGKLNNTEYVKFSFLCRVLNDFK